MKQTKSSIFLIHILAFEDAVREKIIVNESEKWPLWQEKNMSNKLVGNDR